MVKVQLKPNSNENSNKESTKINANIKLLLKKRKSKRDRRLLQTMMIPTPEEHKANQNCNEMFSFQYVVVIKHSDQKQLKVETGLLANSSRSLLVLKRVPQ